MSDVVNVNAIETMEDVVVTEDVKGGIRLTQEELTEVVKEFMRKNFVLYLNENKPMLNYTIGSGDVTYKIFVELKNVTANKIDRIIVPKYVIVTKILEDNDGKRTYFILVKDFDVVKLTSTNHQTVPFIFEHIKDIDTDQLRVLNGSVVMVNRNQVVYNGRTKSIIFHNNANEHMRYSSMDHRLFGILNDSLLGMVPEHMMRLLEFFKFFIETEDVSVYISNSLEEFNGIDRINIFSSMTTDHYMAVISPIEIYKLFSGTDEDKEELNDLIRKIVDRDLAILDTLGDLIDDNLTKPMEMMDLYIKKLNSVRELTINYTYAKEEVVEQQ